MKPLVYGQSRNISSEYSTAEFQRQCLEVCHFEYHPYEFAQFEHDLRGIDGVSDDIDLR